MDTNEESVEAVVTLRTPIIPVNDDIPATVDDIELSEEQIEGALLEATTATIGANIPLIGRLFEFTERIRQAEKEEKLKMLLANFSSRFQSINEAMAKLNLLTSTRKGKILFSKLVDLLDKDTGEEEWIGLLANVLNDMSDANIEQRFKERSYVLSQIDRLTPQAMIVLGKYEQWKTVSLSGTTTTSKHTVSGDWDSQASTFLARTISITDSATILRMAHSFLELQSTGMILLDGSFIKLDIIGAEVYRSIKN